MVEMFTYMGSHAQALHGGYRLGPSADAELTPLEGYGRRALVFVPGLGGSVRWAERFLSQLEGRYDLIVGLDLRGYGLNRGLEPVSPKLQAADLRAFLHEARLSVRFDEVHLAGISLGGVLAAHLASQRAEAFRSLLLLAPAFAPHPRTFSPGFTIRQVARRLLNGPETRMCMPYGLRDITQNPEVLADPEFQGLFPLSLGVDFALGVKGLAGATIQAMDGIHLPTMVVVPGMDRVCDVRAMRKAFHRLPNAEANNLLELPEAFHDVLMEGGTERIADCYRLWLARVKHRYGQADWQAPKNPRTGVRSTR